LRKQFSVIFILFSVLFSGASLASERAVKGWEKVSSGALFVDVRTPGEFEDQHLPGAVNYPLSDLSSYFKDVDKNQPIVVYCRSGNRSGQAKRILNSQGFTRVHNAGGLGEMLKSK
jgi:phage shock protein E